MITTWGRPRGSIYFMPSSKYHSHFINANIFSLLCGKQWIFVISLGWIYRWFKSKIFSFCFLNFDKVSLIVFAFHQCSVNSFLTQITRLHSCVTQLNFQRTKRPLGTSIGHSKKSEAARAAHEILFGFGINGTSIGRSCRRGRWGWSDSGAVSVAIGGHQTGVIIAMRYLTKIQTDLLTSLAKSRWSTRPQP